MQHTVTTYSELRKWSQAYVNGAFGLFFLIGEPGHAKSYIIRQLVEEKQERTHQKRLKSRTRKTKSKSTEPTEKLPDGHVAEPLWIEGGAVSAFKLYQEVYMHLHQPVIMDDVDSVYSDRNLVRLLKALCQTEKVKQVGWHTDSRQLEAKDIPTKFRTRSQVCIIANHWKNLNEHVGSLVSRGVMVDFRPSIQEVFSYLKANKIIKDKDVLKFGEKHLWMLERIDIREFINAEAAKRAKLKWEDALAQSLGIRDMMMVDRLTRDKSYVTTEQRVSEFMRLTGRSRPMFFTAAHKLAEAKADRDNKGKKTVTVKPKLKTVGVMA